MRANIQSFVILKAGVRVSILITIKKAKPRTTEQPNNIICIIGRDEWVMVVACSGWILGVRFVLRCGGGGV